MNGALIANKLGGMVAIAVSGVVGAGLPFALRRSKFDSLASLLNATAAGAFLGLALLHLFEESAKLLESVALQLNYGAYNLAQVCAFLGFALILFIEHIVYIPEIMQESHQPVYCQYEQHDKLAPHGNALPSSLSTTEAKTLPNGDPENYAESNNAVNVVDRNCEVFCCQDGETPEAPVKTINFSSTAFCALIAISIHAVFEGMVVGLAQNIYPVWMASLSILGHKWAESFALACKFLDANVEFSASLFYLGVFITTTPFGIALGMLISSSSDVLAGVCNGIATGTILYVSTGMTAELFPPQSHASEKLADGTKVKLLDRPIVKFFFFMLGATLLFSLSIIGLSISAV